MATRREWRIFPILVFFFLLLPPRSAGLLVAVLLAGWLLFADDLVVCDPLSLSRFPLYLIKEIPSTR